MSDRKQRAKGHALLNLQPIKAGAVSSTLEAIGKFKSWIQQAAQNAVASVAYLLGKTDLLRDHFSKLAKLDCLPVLGQAVR